MSGLRQYLLSVICAAIIVSIIMTFYDKKETSGLVMKVICGILLTVTIISPIRRIRIDNIWGVHYYSGEVDSAVSSGQREASEMYRTYITEQAEAYILKKAQDLGADVVANVMLSEDSAAVPASVALTGNISPYAKTVLTRYISEELGINEEHQVWN